MRGDLPPNSSEHAFKLEAADICWMSLPVRAEPVKAILRIFMCSESALPVGSPKPDSTLRTPSGTPASLASLASSNEERGACKPDRQSRVTDVDATLAFSLLLRIWQLPAAKAGNAFMLNMMQGTFCTLLRRMEREMLKRTQGIIPAVTLRAEFHEREENEVTETHP